MNPISKHFLIIVSLFVFTACNNSTKKNELVNDQDDESSFRVPLVNKVWEVDSLNTPESVIYLPEEEIMIVSNINGLPANAKDSDGYLSKIDLEGNIVQKDWVTGLNAPKGMGVFDNSLFVADIDEIVEIDLNTSKILKKHSVKNAILLNDIVVGLDGKVYVSDTKGNVIYVLFNGQLGSFVTNNKINGPNGLLIKGNDLFIASFNSGIIFKADLQNRELKIVCKNIPHADGITHLGENIAVSSWDGQVYLINESGESGKFLDTQFVQQNAADITYVEKINSLIVPTFNANTVAAYRLY